MATEKNIDSVVPLTTVPDNSEIVLSVPKVPGTDSPSVFATVKSSVFATPAQVAAAQSAATGAATNAQTAANTAGSKADAAQTTASLASQTANTAQAAANSASTAATTAQTLAAAALPRAGGTMTGPIVASGLPSDPSHLASRAYVDSAIAGSVVAAGGTPLSNNPPVMDGTATAGSASAAARADHVHPTDTTRYAANNPQGYQTATQVTAALGSYATTAALNSAVNGLVSTNTLNTTINTALGPYATTASLGSLLGGYATVASVSSQLASYTTTTALNSALGPYATTASVQAAVAPLVTQAQMNAAIAAAVASNSTAATAATTPVTVPSNAKVGTPISGLTTTLTPSTATAYACLYDGTAEVGTRAIFAGTSIPALTPVTANATHSIRIYAAATGGSALATSATFTVAAATVTPTATISGVSTTITVGGSITGSVTLTNISPAYAVLYTAGAEVGSRTSFTGSSLPSLTPAGAGTYTVRIFTASTGGTLLTESPTVTVTAAATPVITIGNITGLLVGSASTVTGTFANGAPTGLTATNDGSAITLTSPTITVTSGASANAAGTFSATFTTPAAGFHNLVIIGTGTFAATSGSYAYSATPAGGTQVTLISPAFYVSPSGNDNNAGTSTSPFATLAKAQTAMRAGSTKTVYVRGGTYNLSSQIEMSQPDQNTNWLGYPGEIPIIDGGGTLDSPISLSYNSSGITVDHLTIRNCRTAGIKLHGGMGVPCNGNTISNNTIYNVSVNNIAGGAGNSGAIWSSFVTTNNIIKNNLIYDCACGGITFATGGAGETVVGFQVLRNRILRTNNTGQRDSGAIYVLDRAHNTNNGIIDGNYIEDFSIKPGAPGVNCDDTKGIYLDDMCSFVTVKNNIIVGKGAMGMQIHGGDNTLWTNNIWDVTQIMLFALYQEDSEFGNYGMGNNLFQKNILYSTVAYTGNVGEAGQPGLWTTLLGTTGQAKPIASGNIYYNTAAQFPNQNDVVDNNPKFINPNFNNPSTRDFSFTDGGAAASVIGFTPINVNVIGPSVQTVGTPAAALSNVSTSSSVGANVTGTVALQYISQAYAVLYFSGADEGTRVPFTGNTLPILHPTVAGNHTLRVYTAQNGGTLLAESGVITVTGPVPFASLSGVTASMTVGGTVLGTVSLVNISTAYVVLAKGGVEQGSRVSCSSGSLPALTPSTTGIFTVRIYTAASGGTLLVESGNITVNAAGTLISPAFFISPSGNDANAGTQSAPFATLEAARAAMRAGSTKVVYLRNGTYNRSVRFEMTALDNGTQWLGYPGETPVIDGGSNVVDGFWLDYHSANITIDHLTFDHFAVCAIHLNGYQVPGDDGTITGVVISNCTIRNVSSGPSPQYGAGNFGGIRCTFATRSCTFTNNLITDTYGPAISMVAGGSNEWTEGHQVLRNRILRTNNTGQNDSGAIYMLDRGHTAVLTTLISGNYVDGVGSGVDTKCIYLDDEAGHANITNNICTGQSKYALQIHGGDNVSITNNIFDLSAMPQFLCLYQDATGAGFANYGMGNNSFTKNIVYTSGGYYQNTLWQYLNQSGGSITTPTVSNNLYFSTSGTLPNTGNIVDSNAVVANPNFTNTAAKDYSFTSLTNANLIGFAPIDASLIGPR